MVVLAPSANSLFHTCESKTVGVQTRIVIQCFRWELIYQHLTQRIPQEVGGVKHESGRSPFWSSDEPTELEIQQTRELYGLEKKVPQMQELQELGKEDYEGFFIPMMGNLIFYLFKSGIGFLILFLLFQYLIGPILMDIMFKDACFGFPGADCS